MANGRIWTNNEIELLSNYAGTLSIKELAFMLHRTETAVLVKKKRLGIRFYDNIYVASVVGKELGKSVSTIKKWYQRGWLKGKKAKWKSLYGNNPTIFEEEDIVNFLKEHYKLFDTKKVPNRFFVNIIKNQIEKDKENK
jgi:transposase